uniref:Zinc finger C2HC domain-containing protein 1A n=1 Tax=Parastrongyloides trichosuri TaxID=131310 RepID=A0A0N4Z8R3_PARTI
MTADINQNTYPCSLCGRKFVQESLPKHEVACQKLNSKKRKVFDSGKQRATGSDINYKDIKKVQQEKQKFGGTFPRPKTNWKERHETFIGAVSASKQVEIAIKTGAPLPPPPKASVPNDYITCEFCGRNFNEKAAERHIPFCKEQSMRKKTPMSRSSSASKSMISAGKPQSTSAPIKREPLPSKVTTTSKPPSRRSSVDRVSGGKGSNNTPQIKSNPGNKKTSNLPMPTKRSNSTSRHLPNGTSNNISNQNSPSTESTNRSIIKRQNSGIVKIVKKDQPKKLSLQIPFHQKCDDEDNNDYYSDYQKFKYESRMKTVHNNDDVSDKPSVTREIDYDID